MGSKNIGCKVKNVLLFITIILLPTTGFSYVKGDIDSDDKIGLSETIYSLQVTAGLVIPLSGTTINVPGDNLTIQEAIDAASDGDTILIAPGTYAEALTINGKLLVLRGAGIGSTTIDGNGSHVIEIDHSSGVVIEDMTLQNGNDGIYATNHSSVEVNRVTIQNCGDRGMQIEEHSKADIADSTIASNSSDGIAVILNSSAIISGAVTIQNNARFGLFLFMESSALVYQSTFACSGNGDDGIRISQSSGLRLYAAVVTSQNNSEDGFHITLSSSVGINGDSTLTIENSGNNGISVYDGSQLYSAGEITIRGSQVFGLIASGTGDVSLDGSLSIENSENIGLLITRTSTAYVADRIQVSNCVGSGIAVSRGSSWFNSDSADITVNTTQQPWGAGFSVLENAVMGAHGGTFLIENNTGMGMEAGRNSTISLRDRGAGLNARIRNNSAEGILVYEQGIAIIDAETSITGNSESGIDAGDGSSINISGSTIQSNNGTQGDINLHFGARSTLNNNTIGTPLSCDLSVLSRGDAVCPP